MMVAMLPEMVYIQADPFVRLLQRRQPDMILQDGLWVARLGGMRMNI